MLKLFPHSVLLPPCFPRGKAVTKATSNTKLPSLLPQREVPVNSGNRQMLTCNVQFYMNFSF